MSVGLDHNKPQIQNIEEDRPKSWTDNVNKIFDSPRMIFLSSLFDIPTAVATFTAIAIYPELTSNGLIKVIGFVAAIEFGRCFILGPREYRKQ